MLQMCAKSYEMLQNFCGGPAGTCTPLTMFANNVRRFFRLRSNPKGRTPVVIHDTKYSTIRMGPSAEIAYCFWNDAKE